MRQLTSAAFFVFFLAIFLGMPAVQAQTERPFSGGRGIQDRLGGFGNPFGIGGEDVSFSSMFELFEGKREGVLSITATIGPDYHIYAQNTPKGGPIRSQFMPKKSDDYEVGAFGPTEEAESSFSDIFSVDVYQYSHEITWQAPVKLSEGVDPESLEIIVKYKGQKCNKSGCTPINEIFNVTFEGFIEPVEIPKPPKMEEQEKSETAPTEANAVGQKEDAPVSKDAVERAVAFISDLEVQGDDAKKKPLLVALGFALMGGFILNFMPCVLPVIGLKVMSFVQQAGADRKQAFMLNLWYSLGLMSVFMVLATLAALFSFGWGQQAQYTAFNITMTAIIFVMGLSFLGVWEIPIPGFVGSGKMAENSEKEGASAAFIKGIITTILAVPCSGPGIATALAWSAGQPTYLVYLVFFAMGLGMAMPYVIIGLNPGLVKFLPKPGAWMDTFKQIMGFALLGTVVFLFTFIEPSMIIPTLAFLIVLWFACWLIGQIPFSASTGTTVKYWGWALGVSAVLGFFILNSKPVDLGVMTVPTVANMMQERQEMKFEAKLAKRSFDNAGGTRAKEEANDRIKWKPFTLDTLESELAKGNTVLIDFTADW